MDVWVKRVAFFVLCLPVLWALINAYEVPLTPQATAHLQPPAAPPPGDNAYFAMRGFATAGSDDGIVSRGQALQQLLQDAYDHQTSFDRYNVRAGEELKFLGDNDAVCSFGSPSEGPKHIKLYACMESASPAKVEQLSRDNAALVARFDSLARYPSFADLAPPRYDAPVLAWFVLIKCDALQLTHLALDAKAGKTDQALQGLVANQRFWRAVLADQGGNTLDKILAMNAMVGNLALTSEILRSKPLDPAQSMQVDALLAPFDKGELDIAPMLWTEYRIGTGTFKYLRDHDALWDEGTMNGVDEPEHPVLGWLMNRFSSYHHQANSLAAYTSEIAELDQSPTTQFTDLRQSLPDRVAKLRGNIVGQVIYDPMGNWLFYTSIPNGSFYAGYKARLIDLEGLRRVIALQREILARRLKPDEIGGFVASAGPDYADPYTGKAMKWDPKSQTLSFDVGYARSAGWVPVSLKP